MSTVLDTQAMHQITTQSTTMQSLVAHEFFSPLQTLCTPNPDILRHVSTPFSATRTKVPCTDLTFPMEMGRSKRVSFQDTNTERLNPRSIHNRASKYL